MGRGPRPVSIRVACSRPAAEVPMASPVSTAPAIAPACTAGPTAALAQFVSEVPRRGVPDPVREVLHTAVIDAVGCGLFGLTTPACRIVQEFASEQGGPEQSTLWASGGRRVSSGNAALATGTAIHGF